MKKQKQGISLISLIITIIVIIILAAIVIFSGMGTPEKAQLSAVISDIDNVQTAVDQAYYGFYTEKSVAGEVWTKSQFYEAVATGETSRENLKGVGIVPISDSSMVKMTLPKYEGRTWGVAVEDIDDHTQVGSVVLLPGYETDGKIYATLLDVQNDGRDVASMELAMGKVNGEGGSHEDGLTEEEKEAILAKIDVGDFVNYKPSAGNSTILYNSKLGGEDADIKVTSKEMNWRILDIDEETGKVLLTAYEVPTLYMEDGTSIDGIALKGSKGYLNGPSELNRICRELYSNSSKGITARSMTVEDLNKACNYTSSEPTIRYAYYPAGTTNTPDVVVNGKAYNGRAHTGYFYNGLTRPEFYTYDDNTGETITTETPASPTAEKPMLVSTGFYTYNLSQSVKDLLGNGERWLASTCAGVYTNCAGFGVRCVNVRGVTSVTRAMPSPDVDTSVLYFSSCNVGGDSRGVCPVVSLSSKLLNIDETGKDGQSIENAWNIK